MTKCLKRRKPITTRSSIIKVLSYKIIYKLQLLAKLSDSCFLSLAEFFKELLSASRDGFHEMFKKTYGILYEQNAYVFTDFFQELENYYAKGTVSTLPLSPLPPLEFDYLDFKMAQLRFISLFAENSVYKVGSRSIYVRRQRLRCSAALGTREREMLPNRTALPGVLPENLELWHP